MLRSSRGLVVTNPFEVLGGPAPGGCVFSHNGPPEPVLLLLPHHPQTLLTVERQQGANMPQPQAPLSSAVPGWLCPRVRVLVQLLWCDYSL
ncbi:hypothetical protein ABT001_34965 [Streptomyces sp. NPDC002793]|uniref:hypothetical protein n=1 Tax=Streptomyces sp. NPDC002793 TaxID=3154432 RepID=UPI00332FDEF3